MQTRRQRLYYVDNLVVQMFVCVTENVKLRNYEYFLH
jgi:hypothetical protein